MRKIIRKPDITPACLLQKTKKGNTIQEEKTEEWKAKVDKYNSLNPKEKKKKKTPNFSLSSYTTLYNCLKVKLIEMTDNHCSFCDAIFSNDVAKEIEHFKPSSIYPDEALEWTNLYIICRNCNKIKGGNYDKYFPLIKPDSENYFFDDFFKFDFTGKTDGIEIIANNKKAQNIIDIYKLNRTNLCIDRKNEFDEFKIIKSDKIIIWKQDKKIKKLEKLIEKQHPLEMLENMKQNINVFPKEQIIVLSKQDFDHANIKNFSFRDLLENHASNSNYKFEVE